ncbi:hypothetical protein MTO96_012015 [Rhipicephalus appendiculatus]
MSAVEDCSELKGGHPPAVKAGGMRITQHKPAGSTHEKAPELKKDDGEDAVEEVSPSPPKPHLVISGVVAKEIRCTAQAVQVFHNKPQPSHEYRACSSKPTIIQQPRK